MPRYSLRCCAHALSFFLCISVWQTAAAARPALLVMGDSLSAAYGMAIDDGWVSLLEQRLQGDGYDFTVINASVSGETTGGGLARLPRALNEHRPEIVIIELGANDGLRGIPPDEIGRNLTRMVDMCQRRGAEVLLAGVQIPANYGDSFRRLYDAQYEAAAKQTDAQLLPSLLAGIAQEATLMQQDGLHPNAQAQGAILNNMWPKLKPLLDW